VFLILMMHGANMKIEECVLFFFIFYNYITMHGAKKHTINLEIIIDIKFYAISEIFISISNHMISTGFLF
jgi:hypothetical protein